MKVRFKKKKETKNKIRFDEIVKGTDSPIVGSLYILKEVAKSSTEVELEITFIK